MYKGSFVEINCQPAQDLQVGSRIVQGLLISDEDAAFLRSLDSADIIISLVCPGRKPIHARLNFLLNRIVKAPFSNDWYVSITGTGPLYSKDR